MKNPFENLIDFAPEKIDTNQIPDEKTTENINDYKASEVRVLQEEILLLKAKNENYQIRNQMLNDYAESLKEDRKLREIYAPIIFKGVFAYIIFVLLIIIFSKNIDYRVLMSLAGTTSLNVIGLLVIVLKSAFSPHHHKILDGYGKQDK